MKEVHAVVGIICRHDRLLVCQRPAGKPYAGYWEFPGGKIEPEESSLNALKRELHEELGIEIIAAELLFQHSHQYPDKNVLLDIWRIEDYAGEPKSLENQEIKWTNAEEIRKLSLLDGNWAFLEAVLNVI